MDWKGFGLDAGGDAIKTGIGLLDTAAKLTLNALYPAEFEVYMVTLELVDHNDKPLDYFTFPVNPDSISKIQPYVKSVDRTYGAVVVNKSGKFVPQDITIKGTFGRQFKFVVRDKVVSLSALQLLPDKEEFSPVYKSGYGCFKIVQKICDESNKLDNGHSRKLYFHNLALGESYLVEVMNFSANQSLSTNMLWGYDLKMKILTNVLDTDRKATLRNRIASTSMTAAANTVAGLGRELIGNALGAI